MSSPYLQRALSPSHLTKAKISNPSPSPTHTKNRSKSRLSNQPSKHNLCLSPSKSPMKTKFHSEMEQLNNSMSINAEALKQHLKNYQSLELTAHLQKCLQHNNILTLYCLNERRVLCVNCLYGIHRHRSHKVMPLKDCMEEIYEDTKNMRGIIEEEIKGLDYFSKIAEENISVVQSEMRRASDTLEKQYKIKLNELAETFYQSKLEIASTYEPLVEVCKKVKATVEAFRFNVWEAYTMNMDWKETDQSEIMKQLLFVTILELCEFRYRIITRSELDSLSRRFKQLF